MPDSPLNLSVPLVVGRDLVGVVHAVGRGSPAFAPARRLGQQPGLRRRQGVFSPSWADPPSLQETLKKRELKSYLEQKFGADGQPLNPMGPTGMTGRGLLGKHGANFAADPIVTTINPQTGQLMMIAIVREDLGQVAIPGGMADHGEKVSGTLASHGAFVKQAVLNWQEQSGMVVGSDGTVGTAPWQSP